MTFFKLEISKIKENYENYKKNIKEISDEYDIVYNSLIGVESCWNDVNTELFIKKVKKDRLCCIDYFEYIDEVYEEIFDFSEDIKSVCKTFGYANAKSIKFDNMQLSTCLNYLDQAVEILNINLKRLTSLTYDVKYASLNNVYTKISNIKKIIKQLTNLHESIESFCKEINSCVSKSQYRKGKIEKRNLGISLLEYNSKTSNELMFNDNFTMNKYDVYAPTKEIARNTRLVNQDVDINVNTFAVANSNRTINYSNNVNSNMNINSNVHLANDNPELNKKSNLLNNDLNNVNAAQNDMHLSSEYNVDGGKNQNLILDNNFSIDKFQKYAPTNFIDNTSNVNTASDLNITVNSYSVNELKNKDNNI